MDLIKIGLLVCACIMSIVIVCNGRNNNNNNNSNVTNCDKIVMRLMYNTIVITAKPTGVCSYCCTVNLRKNVRLVLFTKANPLTGELLRYKSGKLAASKYFDKRRPTVVYVHGFLETCMEKTSSSYRMRDAYLARPEDYNIILVDWSILSAGPWYIQAARNTQFVAATLAKFFRTFHSSGELSLDDVHLIGFSLGAQIAGLTGKLMQKEQTIGRITGLDPALPMFPVQENGLRLNKGDAKFVDVIHTSPLLFGFPISIGDTDFYLNHGRDFQPGCNFEELVLSNRLDDYLSCSHQRAWNSYVDSVINPRSYPGFRCTGHGNSSGTTFDRNRECRFAQVYMGFSASKSSCHGDYYAYTQDF